MTSNPIAARPVPTTQIVMVCAKCTRKVKGGFGRKQKHSLRAMLRDALKAAGRRRSVRVVETGCLSLCPKRAVTVVDSARPGEMLSVPEGTPVEAVLERLAPAD